jgi:predicted CXXCH cytochrome family protein
MWKCRSGRVEPAVEMNTLNRNAGLLVSAVLLGGLLLSAPAPQRVNPGYVDSTTCAACHSEIFKSYRLTGMGRSLYRPSPQNMVEDFTTHNTLYNRASDRYYTLIKRDGKWYQRRHQLGFDGNETNVVEKQIDYVIGSGNHVRSYVTRTAQGTLVELPVSWYGETGGFWAMSPGYDRADQEDFRRTIMARCLACHTAYPAPSQASNLATNEPLFGDLLPEGIDCQRCHGPGRQHIEVASAHATLAAIRAAIVNPARLNRDEQLEVCMQCHLETTHFSLPSEILRDPQQPFSYRPGKPLGDSILFFDHAQGTGHDDKFEIAHAAYRLRKSACFRTSQMTCTTCHNPHAVLSPEQAATHYIAVCRSCHLAAHESKMPAGGNSCIACHMPKRRAEDVVHAVMTDHYIQRSPPARDLLKPLQESAIQKQSKYRGEVVPYYPAPFPRTPVAQLYTDVAQVFDGTNLASGISQLEHDLERLKPIQPEFYVALGDAYTKTKRYDQAIHWFNLALGLRPGFRPALEELGGVLIAAGRLEQAAEVLEKATAPPSPNTSALADLGGVYLLQGDLERAATVLQQALAINPDLPKAHRSLALLSIRKGDWTSAEQQLRAAISAQPDFAEAHDSLANVLARNSQYTEARYHFQKAIANKSDYAAAHHNYGLLLLRMGSAREAIGELQTAIRLDTLSARNYLDLGIALAASGRLTDSADAYGTAIRLDPDFYEAHFALGQLLKRQGDLVGARVHFEKAAESPDLRLREAAQNLLR